MLNNIMIGNYYPIKSKVHSMNPISKMLCVLLFLIINFICNDLVIMIVLSLMTILLLLLAHLPIKFYFKTIKGLRIIFLFIIIIYYFMGTDIDSVICMILRLINIVTYSCILTLTTTSLDITKSLKFILSPLKLVGVPVNKMALSISLSLRFIPTIIDQGNKILKSQASRGIDYYASNIAGKVIALKSMLLPMFVLTIRRADNLAETMQVRLYDINGKRTSLIKNKWSLFDSFMLLIHISLLIVIIIKRVI